MDRGPAYRTLIELVDDHVDVDVDVVALAEFGGQVGNPVAAAVTVDGWTRVRVVAPRARASWDPEAEGRFRAEVRRLAATHDLCGWRGPVRVVFDPPAAGAEARDPDAGEPIDRA